MITALVDADKVQPRRSMADVVVRWQAHLPGSRMSVAKRMMIDAGTHDGVHRCTMDNDDE